MKSRAARALHAPRIPCAGRLRRARAAVSTPARTAGRRRPARRAALAGPGRVQTDGRRGPARQSPEQAADRRDHASRHLESVGGVMA